MKAPNVRIVPVADLILDPTNVRTRDDRAKKTLAASMEEFGPARSVVLDSRDAVKAGNGTLEAFAAAGGTEVLVVEPQPGQLVAVKRKDWSRAQADAYAIADNRTGELAKWDETGLAARLDELRSVDVNLSAVGFDTDEIDALIKRLGDEAIAGAGQTAPPVDRPSLADRFLIPPFSVLDARQGYWQDRKRAWLSLGIQSELGRGGAPGGSPRPAAQLTENGITQRGDGVGRPL